MHHRFDPFVRRSFWPALIVALSACALFASSNAQIVDAGFPSADKTVTALAVSGRTLYVGGYFDMVGPWTGRAVVIDRSSGAVHSLSVGGRIFCAADDGAGGWFIGGYFSSILGVPRSNLAHVRADLTVSPWDPQANDLVYTMMRVGSRVFVGGYFTQPGARMAVLDTATGAAFPWSSVADGAVESLAFGDSVIYVGGGFSSIAGQPRPRLAALRISDGQPTSWAPQPDGEVDAIAVNGNALFVVGGFYQVNGVTRNGAAKFNRTTGFLESWNPNPLPIFGSALIVEPPNVYMGGRAADMTTGQLTSWHPVSGGVTSLWSDGSTMYLGGEFSAAGGAERYRLAAVDQATGVATPWIAHASGIARTIVGDATRLFVGGDFDLVGAAARRGLAAIDLDTKRVTPWNPGDSDVSTLLAYGSAVYVGNGLGFRAFDASTGAPLPPPFAINNKPVFGIAGVGNTLYVGGDFTLVGAQPRSRLAAFDLGTHALMPWNPGANDVVYSLATDGTSVYAGGLFTQIGGQPAERLVAFDAATGARAAAFEGWAGSDVRALALQGSRLYVGGAYSVLDGAPRSALGALDAVTGSLLAWDPPAPINLVASLATGPGPSLYAGGTGSLRAIDATSGDLLSWGPVSGDFSAVTVAGSSVFAGGLFEIGPDGALQKNLVHLQGDTSAGVDPPVPGARVLRAAPVPAASEVYFSFVLDSGRPASLSVFDVSGRLVRRIQYRADGPGTQRLPWDLRDTGGARVADGVYIAQLQDEAGVRTARVVVVE